LASTIARRPTPEPEPQPDADYCSDDAVYPRFAVWHEAYVADVEAKAAEEAV
jgi:hypothetical protein